VRQSRGDLTISTMSQDRRQWIVAYQYDDAPTEWFHYDRAARQAGRLFSSTPAWEGLPFVPMEARHHPRPRRARARLLLVPPARLAADDAVADGAARPRRALGARRMGCTPITNGSPTGAMRC